jgi:hypothetical protein
MAGKRCFCRAHWSTNRVLSFLRPESRQKSMILDRASFVVMAAALAAARDGGSLARDLTRTISRSAQTSASPRVENPRRCSRTGLPASVEKETSTRYIVRPRAE